MEGWRAMRKASPWKTWVVWWAALLASCASSPPVASPDVGSKTEVATSWEEGWEDPRCVTVLCGEGGCAFVRCRDVRGEEGGAVRLARGGPPVVAPPAPRGSPRRWQAGGLWLAEDREPVFIIPWYGAHPRRLVLRDTDVLLRSGKWVQHHIFPQARELADWFKGQGIDIHQFTLVIPRSTHSRIHSGGSRGGLWNEAWREFVRAHRNKEVSPADIWRQAFLLMDHFKLSPGPFVPYR